MTKKIKINDKLKTHKIYDNLIYYNIVFYYHNEPIELIKYYLENLNFLLANMIKSDNNQIIFCICFFVSNLKEFVKLLKNKKFINHDNFTHNKHIIYENKINYIETNFIKIKINDYDFEILVHEIISKPNKNISPNNYDNIYNITI